MPPREDGVLGYSITMPRIRASNYHVKSSFRIPLPPQANAELKINAGIGGPLTRLRKEIEYETESGEKETRSYLMPVSIFTRSISLGMNGSLTLPGKYCPSMLRFFRGCDIEAGTALLPGPVFRTSVSQSWTPLNGARLFRLSLQTTYRQNFFRMPPVVDVSISRQLGPRQFADIGWSSGMWFWPSIMEAALGPFIQLGVQGDAIVPMASYSSCRIGFTSYSAIAKTADQIAKDSDAPPRSNVHAIPGEPSPLGEAWGFELSSPFGGALSVSYGRNLFRGHVRAPLQSEWSQVGYHKNRDLAISRPQAVRLDLQGSLSLDGTIGWMVQGSRAIGDFSRVGLGVGVQGPRGLVVSFTYNRLGQSINLPVVICPLSLVNIDVIAMSIVVPWTLYAAFHYGYILPRAKHKHREILQKQRAELEAVIQNQKTESRRTIELMASRVKRRQAVEMENHGLVVLEAKYGNIGRSKSNRNRNIATSKGDTESLIDVSIPVAGLVHQSQLVIARGVNKVSRSGMDNFYGDSLLTLSSVSNHWVLRSSSSAVKGVTGSLPFRWPRALCGGSG
jgi:DnaJ homolog subfamily C member 11